MQAFEGYNGMYEFKILPEFARFVLQNFLVDYIKETIWLSRKMNLPLLKYLSHWSDEELIEHSKITSGEYLTYLADNKAKQHIENSLVRWLKDQLELVSKFGLVAEDLTLIVHIRSKALKKFIPNFTSDISTILALAEEIDTFNLGELTSSANTYINILKEKIEQEVYFNAKLVNTSPGMIYVYDLAENKVIYTNKKADEIFNTGLPDMHTDDFLLTLTHPDDTESLQEHLQNLYALKDEEVSAFEHRLKDVKGEYRWIRNYETIFKRDEKGKPLQIIGAAYDISAEKKISENLKYREEQLIEAQALAQVGSFEWDIKTDTTVNSKQFYKIVEYTDRKNFDYFFNSVHPEDKLKLKEAFENAFKKGSFECGYRYQINGKEKYIWTKGIVLFENNQPVKMIGTVQDITDRRKIEETLLQKTIELEKTNTDLIEFTHVASHDLKEPLRKIATYADIILMKHQQAISEEGKNYFHKIIDSSRRMQKMIDDILTLSSVTASPAKEVYSLQSILDDVLIMLEHTIQQKKAIVSSDQLPEAPVIPTLFRQLFLNLIGNALKFSKKEVQPHITITHSYLDAHKINTSQLNKACYLCIKVEDNGIGFSNEFSEKIFLLFQRLHSKKEFEGNGLGLAICKRIVQEHNGTIAAHSEPGRGATFTIVIPIKD